MAMELTRIKLFRPDQSPLKDYTATVTIAAFSPDGKRIVTASSDGTARLLDTKPGTQVIEPVTGHTAAGCRAAFNPYRNLLATASPDHTVRPWDVPPGK